MNAIIKFLAVLVFATGLATAFTLPAPRFGRLQRLHMSSPDPMDAIREKMKTDPNYNPMQDPQAMQVLENSVPSEIKELMGAIERVKVAIKDATSGANAVTDLNKVASEFTAPKSDLISTPTSTWFKEGMKNDNPSFNANLKAELKAKVKAANPEVPEE